MFSDGKVPTVKFQVRCMDFCCVNKRVCLTRQELTIEQAYFSCLSIVFYCLKKVASTFDKVDFKQSMEFKQVFNASSLSLHLYFKKGDCSRLCNFFEKSRSSENVRNGFFLFFL